MRRKLPAALAMATGIVVAVAPLSAGSASAATSPSSPTRAATCARAVVTVHKYGSPNLQCLTPVRPGLSPMSATDTTCPASDLALYWNGPIGVTPNYTLCINGQGLVNLNQDFYGLNWNDEASAWWTGCLDVYFYVGINYGTGWGGQYAFAFGSPGGESSPRGSFPYEGVGNDQLSSVDVEDLNGYCPRLARAGGAVSAPGGSLPGTPTTSQRHARTGG